MIQLEELPMDTLAWGGKLLIATYSCRHPSQLLEGASSVELLVGYFKPTDAHLTGACIIADRYSHVEVRLLCNSHRKYCIPARAFRAYLGSSNLGSTAGELGIIVRDRSVVSELRRIHKELWKQATPLKPNPRAGWMKNPQALLEVQI